MPWCSKEDMEVIYKPWASASTGAQPWVNEPTGPSVTKLWTPRSAVEKLNGSEPWSMSTTILAPIGGKEEDAPVQQFELARGRVQEPEPEKTSSSSEPEAEVKPAAHSSGREHEQAMPTRGLKDTFDVHELLRWRASAAESDAINNLIGSTAMAEPSSAPSREAAKPSQSSREPVVAPTRCENVRASGRVLEEKAPKLEASANSWMAQQQMRRKCKDEDTEVVREMKSILNKLTLEKFEQLSQQLIRVNIRTTKHVQSLIIEVFEKAVTQHHFIDMYANLCTLLHEHFAVNPITDDPKFSFKRLLLNECQASFERNLQPPSDLDTLDPEDRVISEAKYKTRMLGNIRFVGVLLARKMLAIKVLIAIVEELLSDPTPEALESLAAILTVTGPVFDTPDWSYRPIFNNFFHQITDIVKKQNCANRPRCLLKDVLDFRAAGWVSSRPTKQEGPSTLSDIAKQAAGTSVPGSGTATPTVVAQRRANCAKHYGSEAPAARSGVPVPLRS